MNCHFPEPCECEACEAIEQQRFIGAAVKVFGWTEDFAGQVHDELNGPPDGLLRELDGLCAEILKREGT